MIAYLVRRSLLAALTLATISFLSFVIVQLPEGDQIDAYLRMMHQRGGEAPGRTPDQLVALRESWGLNRPLIVQYWDWLSAIVLRGDFGVSYTAIGHGNPPGERVRDLVADRLPYTIYLSIFTVLITWIFAIPIGIYSAVRKHTIGDYTFTRNYPYQTAWAQVTHHPRREPS